MTHVRGDLLPFFSMQGDRPEIDPAIDIQFAHATAAPPFAKTTEQLLNGVTAPNGQHILGVIGFREALESQDARIVRTADDLIGVGSGALRVVMGFQGSPVDADKDDNLERMYAAGLRTIGLGYKDPHFVPAFPEATRRLDERGKRYVRRIGEAGLILDLSHAGAQAALDALEIVRDTEGMSAFVSHTGVQNSKNSHPRTFPSEVLEATVEAGGVVGVVDVGFILNRKDNTMRPMLDHINQAVELLGYRNVAVGSDGIYHRYRRVRRREQFERMKKDVDSDGKFASRYPPEPHRLCTPRKMQRIEAGLRETYGYNDEQIQAITGGNGIRFFETALAA